MYAVLMNLWISFTILCKKTFIYTLYKYRLIYCDLLWKHFLVLLEYAKLFRNLDCSNPLKIWGVAHVTSWVWLVWFTQSPLSFLQCHFGNCLESKISCVTYMCQGMPCRWLIHLHIYMSFQRTCSYSWWGFQPTSMWRFVLGWGVPLLIVNHSENSRIMI